MSTLYTYFRSSASFRVRIALNLKGVAYKPAFVNLPSGDQRDPAFLMKNPQGLIPYFEDDGVALSQSLAIIDYLDQTYPEPAFYPADPVDAAIVRSMALIIAADIHPLNNLRVLTYLKRELGCDQEAVNAWYRHWVTTGFEALEKQVQKYGSKEFCFGNELTLADICLVPQVWNARRFDCDMSAFPTIEAIDANLNQLPAFQLAAPENEPDAS